MCGIRKMLVYSLVLVYCFIRIDSADDKCGKQSFEENRIFGGGYTELGEFPWSALLKYRTPHGDGYVCGGALLNELYVITAGHCLKGQRAEQIGRLIAVTLGEYDVRKEVDCDLNWPTFCAPPSIDIPVDSVLVHPDYYPNSINRHNDIALIRLAKSVTYSDFIQPICLPENRCNNGMLKSAYEKALYVSGWGETENKTSSNIKLKAKVPEINTEDCELIYKGKGVTVNEYQICAGGGAQDSCRGDSGGPLMYQNLSDPLNPRWYLAGVVSFGYKNCSTRGVPSVYTKVSAFLDWIISNINP